MENIYTIWGETCILDYINLLKKHRKERRQLLDDMHLYAENCDNFLIAHDQLMTKKGLEVFELLNIDRNKWNNSWNYHSSQEDLIGMHFGKIMTNTIKNGIPISSNVSLDECKVILNEIISEQTSFDLTKIVEINKNNPKKPILYLIENVLFDKIFARYKYEEEEFFNPDLHSKMDHDLSLLYAQYCQLQGQIMSKIRILLYEKNQQDLNKILY